MVLRIGYEVVWRLRRRANVGIGPYGCVYWFCVLVVRFIGGFAAGPMWASAPTVRLYVFSVWRMEILRLGRVKTLPYGGGGSSIVGDGS